MDQYPITQDELIKIENDRINLCRDILEACSNQLARESGRSMSEGAVLRLKMMVNSVKTVHGQEGEPYMQELALSAVYSNKDGSANAQWSKWTPSATLTMTVSNTSAFNKVKPGEFIFVDLIPTDKDS
jgi:hypothetical protein